MTMFMVLSSCAVQVLPACIHFILLHCTVVCSRSTPAFISWFITPSICGPSAVLLPVCCLCARVCRSQNENSYLEAQNWHQKDEIGDQKFQYQGQRSKCSWRSVYVIEDRADALSSFLFFIIIYLFAKNTHNNHTWDKDMIAGQQGTSVH